MEKPHLKNLLYTQALCEVTLEAMARVLAKIDNTSADSIKKEMLAEVRFRAAQLRDQHKITD